jgi:hypothetical protein
MRVGPRVERIYPKRISCELNNRALELELEGEDFFM